MKTGALFLGDQDGCKAFLTRAAHYYVYILRRPDGRPFYVGKGNGPRVLQHENEARHPNERRSNAHKLNVIRAIWRSGGQVVYEIDLVSHDQASVYRRETELIEAFRRLHEGGTLTNLAAGGGSLLGPAPESKLRHSNTLGGIPADNPERATLNRFVLDIGKMGSVVLKPLTQFKPHPTVPYPSRRPAPSARMAVALAASAAANGIVIEGGCRIPRRVSIDGVDGFVENGVCSCIVTSGLARIIPAPTAADEVFELTNEQARLTIGLVGWRKCIDLGIVDLSTANLADGVGNSVQAMR